MADASPMPHPGVRFPPPLLFAAGLVAGWLLHRWRPLPITGAPSTIREAGAVLCFGVWLAVMVAAFATFRRARTTFIPHRPAAALVTHGPYRATRNPMYVSFVALYLGVTLLIDSWWPVVLLPLVVLCIDRYVIAREERYLTEAFPVEYRAYRERVRRWL